MAPVVIFYSCARIAFHQNLITSDHREGSNRPNMTSRLRRLLLVNTRTSGTQSSGVITHIDVRGGAAITGDNGVGKTTTLQLIALFFGYSPNQVFTTNANKEPMLRFVLPHTQSALIFEYQRGDGPDDVNCAVIRRQDNSDAPVYRFIAGEFREEYFYESTGDGQRPVFLNDEGMVRAATARGAQVSPKQAAPAYRHIILKTRSINKDADDVRKLAARFSFSHRSLPLLDRLIACVVKEQINFRDLADVVSTIVLERMGGIGKDNDKKLTLRQGKMQIERWLRDRDACERVQKVAAEVDTLRELLQQLRFNGLKLGEVRGQGRQLKTLLSDYLRAQEQELAQWVRERDLEVEQEAREEQRLMELVNHAQAEWNSQSSKYDAEHRKKLSFAEEYAAAWARKLDSKSQVEEELLQTRAEIQRIEGDSEGISRQFEQEKADLWESARGVIAKMNKGKKSHEEAFLKETTDLATREGSDKQDQQEVHAKQAEEQALALEELNQAFGRAQMEAKDPRVSPALLQRERDAVQEESEHNSALLQAIEEVRIAEAGYRSAKAQFDAGEERIGQCTLALANAQQSLEAARRLLNPDPDTLHGALIASRDQEWKQTIARVIAPELLQRSDLSPTQIQESTHSLYGWGLNLEAIAMPPWTMDVTLRAQVGECEQGVMRRREELDQARADLTPLSQTLEDCTGRNQLSLANQALLQGKTPGIRLVARSCQEAVQEALKRAQLEAKTQLENAHQAVASAKSQGRTLEARQARERQELDSEYSIAREQSSQRRVALDRQVDNDVSAFEAKTQDRCKEIDAARDRKLEDAGVDTKRLTHQKEERSRLDELLNELVRHQPLVSAWNEWVLEGGPARVEDLLVRRDRSKDRLDQAHAEKNQHVSATSASALKFKAAHKNRLDSNDRLRDEITTLDKLDADLMDFSVRMDGRVSRDMVVGELVTAKNSLKSEGDGLHRQIEIRFKSIETPLMAHDSAVKQFLQGTLDDLGASPSVVARAERLAQAYDRIGAEVLVHVNTELTLILNNIGQFRSQIQTFETEVKAFNHRLQEGLNGVVSRFERIQDLRINVVTDFEKLDFVGKLKALDEVTRQHRDQNVATYKVIVPPADAAFALRDFVKVLGSGNIEVDLSQHITLSGSVNDSGLIKQFHRESELEHVSSNGLTAIVLITLLSGLLNVIRGTDPIYVPWVSDEVGRFDGPNLQHLMQMLRDNRIDVVTASPALTPAAFSHFEKRYRFGPRGSISVFDGHRRPMRRTRLANTQLPGAST